MMLSAVLGQNNKEIKSLKYSRSSVFLYHLVVIRGHSLPEFTNSFLDQHSKEKNVMILTADGASDNSLESSSAINCVT